MSATPPVLAICVNWNGGTLLLETIDSVLASNYANLTLTIVDCASTDGSVEELPAAVYLLRLDENLGYAGAINRGVDWARGRGIEFEYLLVMNNDIRLEIDCISELVAAARRSRPCICGPRVLQWQQPELLEASWGELKWNHVLAHFHHQGRPSKELTETPRRVELLLGSTLLVSRDAVERIGAWDETFFLYHEEIDYQYRASRQGVSIRYVPRAQAYHWSGWGTRSDSLRKVYWIRRNTVYFLRKHGASTGNWIRYFSSLAGSLVYNLFTLRWRRLWVISQGVKDGLSMEGTAGD